MDPLAASLLELSRSILLDNPQFKYSNVKIGTAISYEGAPGGQGGKTLEALAVLLESGKGTIISPVDEDPSEDGFECSVSECRSVVLLGNSESGDEA